VGDLLQLIYEYRRLIARRELMGGSLSRASEQRLLGLERLFGQDPDDRRGHRRRRHARCEVRLPAVLQSGERIHRVDITSLGGGGLRVTPVPELAAGERAVIRVVSLDTGMIYLYPVVAKWVAGAAMGMPFIGAPRQVPLAA